MVTLAVVSCKVKLVTFLETAVPVALASPYWSVCVHCTNLEVLIVAILTIQLLSIIGSWLGILWY